MSGERLTMAERKGAISWMTRNPVAANLLMLMLLVGGALSAMNVKQEVFPEFDMNFITITVPFPGATPENAEQVATSVEQAISGVDGIKRITAGASEGRAGIYAELLDSTDANVALADIKNAVDRITTLPSNAEEPIVSLLPNTREVISLYFYGQLSSDPIENEKLLRGFAERARDRLKASDDITRVEIPTSRAVEMAVEISSERLRHYKLTHRDVAQAVRGAATELPGGAIKTPSGEVLLNTKKRPETKEEFENLVLLTDGRGAIVRVRDVGVVHDTYADNDQATFYNGKPAAQVQVFREGTETPLSVAAAVRAYLEEAQRDLPAGVEVATGVDWSEMYRDRLDLMLRNAGLGFLLVLLVLGLFLEIRLAFWVTVGIPISFLGSLLVVPYFGVSINMISMFAFIITLGMVVDDAIVVGENIYERRKRGQSALKAAIYGCRDVAKPVTFSILTTVAAFMPMFFVPGVSGKLFGVIPAIVVSVLLMSLIESFFILPAHLGHGESKAPLHTRCLRWGLVGGLLGLIVGAVVVKNVPLGLGAGVGVGVAVPFALMAVSVIFGLLRGVAAPSLEFVIAKLYRPVLIVVLKQRYLTLAASMAFFMVACGMFQGGRLQFTFMPKVEGDQVTVTATLPFGSPVSDTKEVNLKLVDAAQKVLKDYGGEALYSRGIYSKIGGTIAGGGPVNVGGGAKGGHVTAVQVQLVPSGDRSFGARDFAAAWRKALGPMPKVRTTSFKDSTGPGAGMPIDIKLSHEKIEVLEQAATDLALALEEYEGVKDIDSGFQRGKPQVRYKPSALGDSLGLDNSMIGSQVRGAFYGAEAFRQQRGRDEMKVLIRLPEADRKSAYAMEELMIRTPRGEVPLRAASTLEEDYGFTSISRADEQRAINVKADMDRSVTSPEQVFPKLLAKDGPLIGLVRKYPGLSFGFDGERKERMQSMESLAFGGLFALIAIYALLAIPFRSYSQPIVVMSAIPLGVASAIYGHMLMGYDLSLISIMGMIALSGVVINDSLVLIDAANKAQLNDGMSTWDSIVYAGQRRFRPIALTSLTTFFGLAPMIFETSMQARFLIPMAISLGFGILFATFALLLSVPAVFLIVEDVKRLLGMARPLHEPTTPEQIADEVPAAPAPQLEPSVTPDIVPA